MAVARTRDARYNSWDKNDPKDAQVILHLLETGTTQRYYDPLVHGGNDMQELANTYQQISLQKVRLLHSILTHYLPLYFPEAARYSHSSRAEWFAGVLHLAPCPAAVVRRSQEEFIREAAAIDGRKNDKARWLTDFYRAAESSVGLPVEEDSEAIRMFRLVVEQYRRLCILRRRLEQEAVERLADYTRLQTIPGIGPVLALLILGEVGDLRRFAHHRQFLKYCGFDLSTQQSGRFRGATKLSKRGNARLRYAFCMAGAVAVRVRENSFRQKFDNYVRRDPQNADLKRKAYTAVAAKVARVAYALIKTGTDYRRFEDEASMPGGRIPSLGPSRRLATS